MFWYALVVINCLKKDLTTTEISVKDVTTIELTIWNTTDASKAILISASIALTNLKILNKEKLFKTLSLFMIDLLV